MQQPSPGIPNLPLHGVSSGSQTGRAIGVPMSHPALCVVCLGALWASLVGCDPGQDASEVAASGGGAAQSGPSGDSGSSGDTASSGDTEGDAGSKDSSNNCSPGDGPSFDVDALPKVEASFLRGFNFGSRLDAPREGEWAPALTEGDFDVVAAAGFDHVRLPVRFSAHAASEEPFTLDCVLLERVDWAIEQALGEGLSLVLDMQYYSEPMEDPAAHRDRFVALWSQLASRYRDLPDAVAFEPLNDPEGASNAEWNELVADVIEAIRETNPERRIVIDSTEIGGAEGLEKLTLPEDSNLFATVHLYEPEPFTLQGADWLEAEWLTIGVLFPGPPSTPLEPVAAAAEIDWMKQWFDALVHGS